MTTTAATSLKPMQRRAARLLGLGLSQPLAAARAGCSDRAIRLWKQTIPAFNDAVREAASEAADPQVYDVLVELLNDADPRVRLGAARELNAMAAAGTVPRGDNPDAVRVVLHDLRRPAADEPT